MMVSRWFKTKKERKEFIKSIKVRRLNKAFTNVEHDGKFYTSFEMTEAPFAGLDKLLGKRKRGGE